MAAFGWSFGDVVAGISVVWNVYQSLSDGPLNARLEFSQFFDEFAIITSYLEEWQSKVELVQNDSVGRLHRQLRQQCETFIKRHMLLIQEANPRSRADREGRSTWLQNVAFSRDQITVLYQRVAWPMERKEVAKLRNKLVMFLEMSTHAVTVENRDLLLEIKASNAALQESNLKLVSSHLEFVTRITQTFKQVVFSPGHEASRLDAAKLLSFEEALLPPRPLKAIEASPIPTALPWRVRGQLQIEERESEMASTAANKASTLQPRPFSPGDEQMVSQRLENLFKRSGVPAAAVESASAANNKDVSLIVQQLLERLGETRAKIGEALGLPMGAYTQAHMLSMIDGPQHALLQELGVWNQFEERVGYEVHRRENLLAQTATNPARDMTTSSTSLPIPIPPRRQSMASCELISPLSGSPGTSVSPTANSTYESSLGSPGSPFRHHRGSSFSSISASTSVRLDKSIPVFLQYQYKNQTYEFEGSVQSLSRTDEGEVYSITTLSKDGLTEIWHCLDKATPNSIETSMNPFLDNGHIDKVHKYRVLFQGSHILKFTKLDSQGQYKATQKRCSPIYKFSNKKDDPSLTHQSYLNYIQFQELLLNKKIALLLDVALIDCSSKGSNSAQCRLGTIRILVDEIYGSRSIFYFRKTKEQQPAFVEWPTSLFKKPKEPGQKSKSLTLDSIDGKSLSISAGTLARRSTQGSVTTIASIETPTIAFSRLQDRVGVSGKAIRGLVIDFYDAKDCHEFWKEFTVNQFRDVGLNE